MSDHTERVFDIVCAVVLEAAAAPFQSAHAGEAYYFCSRVCKEHFDADPEKYTGREPR